jgi:hypothetical protein
VSYGSHNLTKIDSNGRIWIGWDNLDDAIEVAYVIQNAGIDSITYKITDRGFYEDGVALFETARKEQEKRARQ